MSLTPAQVATDLQVSVPTVLAKFRDGTLPGFRIGRSWRIDAWELEAWKAGPARPADPNRIEPRSPRSTAAQARRKAS